MTIKHSTIIDKSLWQIGDIHINSIALTKCPNLVYGKMGIAVFFVHYVWLTNIELSRIMLLI